MKKAMLLVLALATTAHAQLYLVPDNRVSVYTNGKVYLTNTVLRQDLSIIDTNLVRLHGSVSSLSNRLISVSNMVVGASNRADAAYDLALSATNVTPSHMAYVYTVSNTITLVLGTAGNAFFTTTTQDLAAVQIGHIFTTNLGLFAAGSVVTAVDRTSGSNRVTFSGGGLLKSTNNASVAITNAGSFTHTVPAGYSRCKVTVTGSGATGGSDSRTYNYNTGSGGGAGGTAICYLRLGAGSSVAITVGKKAAIVTTAGLDGNDGNASSFGSYCTAYGGSKGLAADNADGGYGGSAYGGSINIVGGQGDPWGRYLADLACGGSSFFGGGVAARRDTAPYGAGGSGWMHRGDTTDNYGCAGDGIVIIEYY
jgi:hypothetical protein